jgi:hypothetical protein
MIYVRRDDSGDIVAISRKPATAGEGAWEPTSASDPAVLMFACGLADADNPLSGTDLGLVRVLEDLIELLIERSVIRFTDFPAAAQEKLLQRRHTRSSLDKLRLVDDDDGLI